MKNFIILALLIWGSINSYFLSLSKYQTDKALNMAKDFKEKTSWCIDTANKIRKVSNDFETKYRNCISVRRANESKRKASN